MRSTLEPEARSSSHSRCMTSWSTAPRCVAVFSALHRAEATKGGLDLSGAHLVEDALDELRLDAHRIAREFGVAIDRAYDRRGCSLTIEAIEPEGVREQARYTTGEAVELCKRVLRSETRTLIRSGAASTPGRASANDPGPPSSAW